MIRILGRYIPIKSVILALTECVLIVASILLATWIRFGNLTDTSWYLSRPYTLGQIATVTLICIICFYYNDLYDLHVVARRAELIVHLLQSLGTITLILGLVYYIAPDLSLGRGISALGVVLIFVLLLAWRLAVDKGDFFRPVHRLLVAGTGVNGIRLVKEIVAHPELNLRVVGFLDETGE